MASTISAQHSHNRKPLITHERLRELVHYDQNRGIFLWRVDRAGGQYHSVVTARAGDVVRGQIRSTGRTAYLMICVESKKYRAHRLAWLYVHGEWPGAEIDHVNGDGLDNRISNLRLCTRAQNMWNTRKRNDARASRLKGAMRRRRDGRWYSQISVSGARRFLGVFDTPEEAHDAYCKAAAQMRGEFFRIT